MLLLLVSGTIIIETFSSLESDKFAAKLEINFSDKHDVAIAVSLDTKILLENGEACKAKRIYVIFP